MLDEIPIEDQYVFTSLRYDGSMKRNSQNPVCCPDSKAAYLIKYHYERLVTAADHLGWYDTNKRLKGPVDLFNRIQTAVTEHKKKTGNKCPFKVCISSVSLFLSSPKNFPLHVRHDLFLQTKMRMRHRHATTSKRSSQQQQNKKEAEIAQ